MAGRPGDESVASAGLLARHLARHLGVMSVRVENRPATSAVDFLNAFAKSAPPDGTVVALAPPFTVFMQALGAPEVAYNARNFAWLGAMSSAPLALAASWVTGFRSIDDGRRREMDLGAVGENNAGAIFPFILNGLLRTRFRVASDYRSDKDVDAALDTGAIGGRLAFYSTFMFGRSDLFQQERLNYLVQIGATRRPELGTTPLLREMETKPADRTLVELLSAEGGYNRALALPAGAPEAIVTRYRRALAETLVDPEFVVEARNSHIEVSAVPGDSLASVIAEEITAPPALISSVRRAIAESSH